MCNEETVKETQSLDNSRDLRSMSHQELEDLVIGFGDKKFRANQLFSWIHQKKVSSMNEMTNIPNKLKLDINTKAHLYSLNKIQCQTSKIDGTKKYLFELEDGNMVESVWMSYHHGNSVCISSQVGCKMGCRFCASTIDGWLRNLTAGEMLEQIYAIERDTGERVSNIVVMGTGEPMDNFDNIIRFLQLINDKEGANISLRNITVSTCGIVPKILELAQYNFPITLAISLHATNQEKRLELMPIANKYSIDELLDACRKYYDITGRRVSFEYSLVSNVNDTDDDAHKLGKLLKDLNCHVNLIRVNPIKERNYVRPDDSRAFAFQKIVEKYINNVTIRREMGSDIDGACGQLRRRYSKESTRQDK